MIELKILIDEIDYDSVADFLVPLLVEKLKKEDRTGLFGSVLSGNSAMASNMARGLLEKLPQEKKDELVVQLLTKNRDKLLETGRTAAAKNGIRLQICDVSAKKIGPLRQKTARPAGSRTGLFLLPLYTERAMI